jgi:hypothetical protein
MSISHLCENRIYFLRHDLQESVIPTLAVFPNDNIPVEIPDNNADNLENNEPVGDPQPRPNIEGTTSSTPGVAGALALVGMILTFETRYLHQLSDKVDQADDYSYFNDKLLENYAGPQHWKFNKGKKDAKDTSGTDPSSMMIILNLLVTL